MFVRKRFIFTLMLAGIILAHPANAMSAKDYQKKYMGKNDKVISAMRLAYWDGAANSFATFDEWFEATKHKKLYCLPQNVILNAKLLKTLSDSHLKILIDRGESLEGWRMPDLALISLIEAFPCKK